MPHTATQNRLNDRDILTDLLLTSKHMISAYGLAEQESTNPQLRATLHRLATEEEQFHTQAFQAMHQRGWYETPLADSNLARQIASLWSNKLQKHSAVAANQQYPAGQTQPTWQSHPTIQQPYNQSAYNQQYGQPHGQQSGQPYAQQGGQPYGQRYGQQPGQPSPAYGTPQPAAAFTGASPTPTITPGHTTGQSPSQRLSQSPGQSVGQNRSQSSTQAPSGTIGGFGTVTGQAGPGEQTRRQ